MGLSRALFSGISGLKGHAVKLDVIGNNIANVNTIGFKKSRVNFSDLFYDTVSSGSSPSDRVGGQNPKQIGLGAGTPIIEQIMTEGATQTTGVGTDLAIAGEGFFVVGDNYSNYFTRDGNFKLDEIGDLVAAGGSLRVKGYMADRDETGAFVVDSSGQLEVINLQENRKMYAKATDLIEYSSNLDSGSESRKIAQADTIFTYRDDSSNISAEQNAQSISFTFQKIDGTTYTWTALDTNSKPIATGEMTFTDYGEILTSTVKGAGGTKVNYDFNDPRFIDIVSQNAYGDISAELDSTNNYKANKADGVADLIFDPESEDFRRLSDRLKPRAFSFTYDPDGDFIPGSWSDPNGPKEFRQDSSAINNKLTTSVPGAVVNNININNNFSLGNKHLDADNFNSIKVSITNNGAVGGPLNAEVYAIEKDGTTARILGTMYAIDVNQPELNIAIPGLIDFRLVSPTSNPPFANNQTFEFDIHSSGSLTRANGADFNLSNAAYNSPPQDIFDIRYVDASKSEYTGDLRIQFTGPTSFQILGDNNQVLTNGSLRNGEVDTVIEVKGITLAIHREGNALLPLDVSDQGFEGTSIRLRGFRAAEGLAGPVTVNIPKPSELNTNGTIANPEFDINFNIGFSSVTANNPVPLKNTDFSTYDATGAKDIPSATLVDSVNEYRKNNPPNATITVDSTMATAGASGSYQIEFGVKDIDVPFENLNNQVLKVYQNGIEVYVIDLNPIHDNTLPNQYLNAQGDPISNTNYMPHYNFFAEMTMLDSAFDITIDPGTQIAGKATGNNIPDSSSMSNQAIVTEAKTLVTRQINLPNGVVINLSNVDASGNVGTNARSATSGSANFMLGDRYSFDVNNSGQAGLNNIGTYSAAFQRGTEHSTSIEVFDSLGGSHQLKATFEHVDKNAREWNYYITLDVKDPLIQAYLKNPPAGYTVKDSKNPTALELRQANDYVLQEGRMGKLVFTESGTIDLMNSFIPNVAFKPADAAKVKINLDMLGITQFEEAFGTAARFRTGNSMGLLEGFSIGSNGEVIGAFSNGLKATIAQLAVASFNNPEGLVKKGNNVYDVSANSGIARIGKAGSDDRGLIKSGSLESSNVDLTEEFTDLIVTQRAFSANGRIITTSDEFLQEILQLKR